MPPSLTCPWSLGRDPDSSRDARGGCEAASARPGTGHLGRRCAGPPAPTAGRGSRGPWWAEDRNQRGVHREGRAPTPRPPPHRPTHRPGAQSEMGILHLKCPDLWPRQPPGHPPATMQALARARGPGSTQSGALTESGSPPAPPPAASSGPHPLLPTPLCSCSSLRDTVPT